MYSEFVYVLKAGPYYKIGRTKNVESRIGTIALQMPFPVELFKVINTADSAWLEKLLHCFFGDKRVNGEWFALNDEESQWILDHPASIDGPPDADEFMAAISDWADSGLPLEEWAANYEREI